MARHRVGVLTTLLALTALLGFSTPALAACVGGSSDGILGSGEQCDGGLGCATDCTCGAGYVPASPVALACDAIPCYNPISTLSSGLDSYITVNIASSLVDFHAYMKHQTNTTAGQTQVTSVQFSQAGTSCDYPTNTYLSEQTLSTTTCYDDYSVSSTAFAGFSSCLSLECTDTNGLPVDCTNSSTCTAPPCIKTWSASVRVGRTYTLFNVNNVPFASEVATYHPLTIEFPWVLSNTVNAAVWATPNVAGSAVITSVVYDPVADQWTVVVSSSLNWPYELIKPVSTDAINGKVYTLTPCAATPNSTVACDQTLTFVVSGCTGLTSDFAGVAKTFTGLKYDCFNQTHPDCPLAVGDIRDAVISVVLDSSSPCGVVNQQIVLIPSDLAFTLNQPDYVAARNSFIQGDILNFVVDITKNIPEASIASIDVVFFEETVKNAGTTLSTSKVTSPTRCSSPSTLCFTFDSTSLANLPAATSTDLTFKVTVDVEFTGIAKRKRMVFEARRFALSTGAIAIGVSPDESGAMMPIMPVLPFLVVILSLFFF